MDLSRLVQADPRWAELKDLDARARHLRQELGISLPSGRAAEFPEPLSLIPDLPAPGERADPATLEQLTLAGEAAMKTQQEHMAAMHQARLDAERLKLGSANRRESDLRHSEAATVRWRANDEILRRYQREATRLRLAIGRLEDFSGFSSEVPEARARQQERLVVRRAELDRLRERRDAEVAAADKRIRDEVAEKDAQGQKAVDAALSTLEEELRSQRDAALRTAKQEMEERVELAREVLREPPPAPLAPPPATSLAPAEAAAAPPTPSKPGASGAPLAALGDLETRSARLERALRDETRRRVLGIAARSSLRVQFAGGRDLPDRTAFFARQLRVPD